MISPEGPGNVLLETFDLLFVEVLFVDWTSPPFGTKEPILNAREAKADEEAPDFEGEDDCETDDDEDTRLESLARGEEEVKGIIGMKSLRAAI